MFTETVLVHGVDEFLVKVEYVVEKREVLKVPPNASTVDIEKLKRAKIEQLRKEVLKTIRMEFGIQEVKK